MSSAAVVIGAFRVNVISVMGVILRAVSVQVRLVCRMQNILGKKMQ